MFHMVIVCGACDTAIEDADYDNRHWDEDGYTEYHAHCCPGCQWEHTQCDPETAEAMRNHYGWDRMIEDILNKEDK